MNRDTLFLAALLHDIGKFWQRADPDGAPGSKILSANTKKNEGLYCPLFQGKYSHKHVLWTAEFLDRNQSFFEHILGSTAYEPFFKACVMHHNPDHKDVHQRIVQKADHYASGADRTEKLGQADAEAESNSWDKFKNVRMVSVFGDLLGNSAQNKHQIPIKAMNLSDGHFPESTTASPKGQPAYAELWAAFEQEFAQLQKSEQNTYSLAENLTALLYRYATTVPSSTMHHPDVSLYDHLKSTATFALCLYDYLAAKNDWKPDIVVHGDEAPFLLVGGDLSGIQQYIYDIPSKDAAKNLKGRSFYLQILVENTVETILRNLQLPSACIVYASGGGFYLLAPNTPQVIKNLEEHRSDIAKALWQTHQNGLSLQMDWQPVTHGQIFGQKINEAWRSLTQKIAQLKQQKFKETILLRPDHFFTPQDPVLENGTQHKIEEALKDLGKVLRKTDVWATSTDKIPQLGHIFQVPGLNIYNYLLSHDDLSNATIRHPDRLNIRFLNQQDSGYDQARPYLRGKHCVYSYTYYGGNQYPTNEYDDPLTFDKLAENGDGAQKLGILRMDVDNLGAIFIKGFDDNRRTFSRYSVLSRNLDFFFKGYLNLIWEQEGGRGSANIIYSGGDDLFIVGHWSATIRLAQRIQKDFGRWCCQNPNLGISGGIALVDGKFPIAKGAKMAEEAEKLAKGHQHGKDGSSEKNSLTLLDTPLSWQFELPIVLQLQQEMLYLQANNKLPKGVFQKLQVYAAEAKSQQAKNKSHAWKWRMAYDLSRAAGRDGHAKEFYDKIWNAAFTNIWETRQLHDHTQYDFIELLGVAARWAELVSKSLK